MQDLERDYYYNATARRNTYFYYFNHKTKRYKKKYIKANTNWVDIQAHGINKSGEAIFRVNKYGYIYIPVKDIKYKLTQVSLDIMSVFNKDKFEELSSLGAWGSMMSTGLGAVIPTIMHEFLK